MLSVVSFLCYCFSRQVSVASFPIIQFLCSTILDTFLRLFSYFYTFLVQATDKTNHESTMPLPTGQSSVQNMGRRKFKVAAGRSRLSYRDDCADPMPADDFSLPSDTQHGMCFHFSMFLSLLSFSKYILSEPSCDFFRL
jgi:hypothetical protein